MDAEQHHCTWKLYIENLSGEGMLTALLMGQEGDSTTNKQSEKSPYRNYNPTLSSSAKRSNPGIASLGLTMPLSSLTFSFKPEEEQEKSGITEGVNSELEMDLNQTPGLDQNFPKGQAGG